MILKTDIADVKYILSRYLKPYKFQFAVTFVFMILVAGLTSTYSYLIKDALDEIFVNKKTEMLVIIPVVIAVVAILKNLCSYFQVTTMAVVMAKIANNIRKDIYQSFIMQDMKLFTEQSSGNMASRVIYDVEGLSGGINTLLTTMIRDVLTIVFLLALLFYQNPVLTLLSLISAPITIFPMVRISKKIRQLTSENQKGLDYFLSKMDDALKSPKLIKSYNAETFEIEKMNGILGSLLRMKKKITRISSISSPLNESISVIGIALVIWYGGYQVISGQTTSGVFFSFFIAMTIAYKPLKSLSNINLTLNGFLNASKRVVGILKSGPTITSPTNAVRIDKNLPFYRVDFKNVYFSYLQKDQKGKGNTLSNVSFSLANNNTIALVGPTGAGKSTIISLLLRLYDVTSGSIEVNGIDIRNIHLSDLRNLMSFVSQEVQLLDDTVENNIRYNTPNATIKDIKNAASLANADEFIEKLPNGYQANIGQSGIKLSGGQRQRISIARAILRDSPIVLLDEATSSLDSISEKYIQKALENVIKNKITIVVAHRLSTIRNADNILVIEGGMIAESGTHDELVSKNGHYSKLYNTQFGITE